MIERFNFYDLYGYAFPGVAVILVVWLPFVLVLHMVPKSSLSAAIVIAGAAVAAYFVGHLVQTIAAVVLPSKLMKRGLMLAPSAFQLDPSDTTFSPELKAQIEFRVKEWFGLEIDVKRDADEALAGVRQDAFFMCRGIVNQSSSYGEQQQGMYTLMRGLTLVSMFGVWYTLGWALSFWPNAHLYHADVAIFTLAAVTSIALSAPGITRRLPKKFSDSADRRYSAYSIATIFLASGYFLGSHLTITLDATYVLWATIALYSIAFSRFSISYPIFASGFAKTIWNHFAAEPRIRPTK